MEPETKKLCQHLAIALPHELAHILTCYMDIVEEETDPREGIGHLIGYWANTQNENTYGPDILDVNRRIILVFDGAAIIRDPLINALVKALIARALAAEPVDEYDYEYEERLGSTKKANAAIMKALIDTAAAIVGDD